MEWCTDSNLALNMKNTKELITDFRKKDGKHIPIHINRTEVECVASFKFLAVHIPEDYSWTLNTSNSPPAPDSCDLLTLYHRELLANCI